MISRPTPSIYRLRSDQSPGSCLSVQADMWLHLIVLLVTQCSSRAAVRNNPLLTLTNSLTTNTERGWRGEVVHITCRPGNKVTTLSVSPSSILISLFPAQLSIQSVLVGSPGGSGGRCESQSDPGLVVVQRECQGRQECHITVPDHLLQAEALLCSGGDR